MEPVRDQVVSEDAWKFGDAILVLLPYVLDVHEQLNLPAIIDEMERLVAAAADEGDEYVRFLADYTRKLATMFDDMGSLVLTHLAEADEKGLLQ